MPKAIAPDYGQQFIFPPALEDFVPASHPVRFLREFVDQLDLPILGLQAPENLEGRPGYAPSLLLKIWLYGYLHRIRSTRQLEAACADHLPLLWLTGLLKPDHNSLWRFWRDHKKTLRQIFKRTVHLAMEAGLVGLALQALDGTKIQAVASGRTGWTREQMEKLLEELDKEVEQTEKEVQQEGEPAQGYLLPESLQKKESLREAVKNGLKTLEQSGRNYYHQHEPEAQRMQCDGKNRFGYNAQAVIDSQSGIALAAEVINQENDLGQLTSMTQAALENTGAKDKQPTTVADSGYGAGADLQAAQAAGLQVLCYPQEGAPAQDKPYHARHFHYDAVADAVICPRGERLHFERQRKTKGKSERVFRCRCAGCPVRTQCTREKRGRTFAVRAHTVAVQTMRERLADSAQKAQLKQRGLIVEKHFARVKEHAGFRRWTVRGPENARAQWNLLCSVLNLRILIQAWQKKLNPLAI
jgi:transposase